MYGVRAVFGRDVLYEWEMDNMRISKWIADSFHSREQAGDWVKWNEHNPSAASALDWAAAEFKKTESEWSPK